ncbi:bcl-2-modifying factor isoform X1 [Bufo gargarizans]|uniref:bcl-2-modifying factor isoform X1 n=1 Tax=Bufo gargarizans TaxID=30331 RepID=UPI001CF1AC04|nr:bcl-2-modifying factor isoform X1 [Bufo gargarizans]
MNTILSLQEGDSQDRMEHRWSSDELDDDVFYPDDFEFSREPLTSSTSMFSPSPPYNCLLGRFHLFTVSHCCGPGCRITESKDKATQTLEPSSLNGDVMLPCGVSESPQRLFYGNAGYLLHPPTNLTLRFGSETGHLRQEQNSERRIARKLQCIGDQFHRLHLQRIQQNRNQIWFQLLVFFRNLVIHRERNRGGFQR